MKRFYSLLLCASLFLSVAVASKAQMIANKKLSSSDLEAAQAEAKSAGG
ncbi:MAG: hypothetical protein HYR56_16575, partial [Acidobacteria bacterium]|nr:hypothetical protein [Acidobacteriota bacterium]